MAIGHGPLFILDGDGRPLMPAGVAQGRIARGRAVSLAHPAFEVVQLNRTYETPSLQACYLTIRPHRHAAELFLVAEGTAREYPILHLVVDLEVWFPPVQPGVPDDRPRPWPDPEAYARAVGDVIAALQRLAPLSHVSPIAPSAFALDPPTTVEGHWLRQVTNGLLTQIIRAGLSLGWSPLASGYRPRKEALEMSMASFVASPWRYASTFVARHGDWPFYPPLLDDLSWSVPANARPPAPPSLHRGESYITARLENGWFVPGIANGPRTDARIRLLAPDVVAPTHVLWGCIPARNARKVSAEADGMVRFFRAVPLVGPQSHTLRRTPGPPQGNQV